MIRRALLVACTLAALAAATVPPAALAATPRTTLPDVEDEVMCVVCRVPLNIADAPQADRERAFIRQQIALGKTKAQVKQALVGQYGEDVLAMPGDAGFRLTNWLVPAVIGVALLGGVALLLPRWRRRGAATRADPAAAIPELDPGDARRLDEDLARYL